MSLAVNKYRTLVDDNTWNQQSAQQKQIVALNAQLQKFIGEKNKNKPTSVSKESRPKPTGNGSDKKGAKDRKYLIGSIRHHLVMNLSLSPSKERSFIGASIMNYGASILRISVARPKVALMEAPTKLQKATRILLRFNFNWIGTLLLSLLMMTFEESARVFYDSVGHSSTYHFLS